MKYKLLRDLPGYEAGIVFEYDTAIGTNWRNTCSGNWVQSPMCEILDSIRTNPSWLEQLPDEPVRWRADNSADYFSITLTDHGSLVIPVSEQGDPYDNARYKIGNYFRTEAQAQTVADAMKALLEYVHSPIASTSKDGANLRPFPMYEDDGSFIRLADEARKAVQPRAEEK